jgi:hypothetical protein
MIDFPDDVYLYVISKWISPDDLCHFDSSMCNFEQRKYFLLLMGSETFSIIGHDSSVRYSIMKFGLYNKWLADRSIKVRNLCLFGSKQIFFSSLNHNFEQIRKLELAYVNGFVTYFSELSILNSCKLLNDLTLWDVESFNELFENVQNNLLSNVIKLKLISSNCIPIRAHVTASFAEQCSSLVYLHLCDNYNNEMPGVVTQLVRLLNANPNLLCITLQNANLDDRILVAIQKTCRNVHQVHLSGSSRVTFGSIMDSRDCCPALTSFQVRNDRHPPQFILDSVDIMGTFRIAKLNDVCLVSVFDNISSNTINLSRVTEITIVKLAFKRVVLTDSIILSVARNSPNLELLCVNDCGYLFSMHSMCKLARICLHLSHLHLGACNHFTPHDLVTIFRTCQVSLRVVSIAHNDLITGRDIQNIICGCKKVVEVCANNCALISPLLEFMPVFHQRYDKKSFEDFFGEDTSLF